MRRIRSAAVLAVVVSLSGVGAAQRELATDARLVAAVGGTTWMTNGAGTEVLVASGSEVRATGVDPRGEQGVPTEDVWVILDALRDRVRWIGSDGATVAIQTPFVVDGLKADAPAPTVWREVVPRGSGLAPVIEVGAWSNGVWQRWLRTAPDQEFNGPSCPAEIVVRPSRYAVRYHFQGSGGDAFVDLLDEALWFNGNETGTSCQLRSWDGGVFGTAEWAGGRLDRVIAWLDDGHEWDVYCPPRWGWNGGFGISVSMPTGGFPIADVLTTESVHELTSFTAPDPRFVPVPGTLTECFHHGLHDDLVAVIDDGAGRLALMVYDDAATAWRTLVTDLRAADRVGVIAGGTLMSLTTSTGLDRLIHLAPRGPNPITPLIDGVRGLPGPGSAMLGGRLLFAASSAATGDEPWVTDGTPQGTRPLTDLTPGPAGSGVARILAADGRAAVQVDSGGTPRVLVVDSLDLLWRLNPVNGHRYRRISARTFPEALAEASRLGGHLVTIQDAAEQSFLESAFGPANLWIGLRREPSDPTRFGWVTGEPLTFTNWCANEPSGPFRESAVHLADYPGFCIGGWNDQDPTDRLEAIVEREAGPDTVAILGAGCPTRFGLPPAELAIRAGVPLVGERVEFRMTGYFSTSQLSWFVSLGLPGLDGIGSGFPLALPGRPDCFLEFAPVTLDLVPSSTGLQADFVLEVPADPALFGESIYVQGLQWSGSTWFLDFGATNALQVTFGT